MVPSCRVVEVREPIGAQAERFIFKGHDLGPFVLQATAARGMATSSPQRVPLTAPRTRSGATSGVTFTAVARSRVNSSTSEGVRSLDR